MRSPDCADQGDRQEPARAASTFWAVLSRRWLERFVHVPPLRPWRIVAALVIAVAADGVQLVLGPLALGVADEVVDVVAMLATTWLLGFHVLLLPTFLLELLPVADVLPTWTACVAVVVVQRRRHPPETRRRGSARLLLLGLLSLLLVLPLGTPPISTRGEAREALVVRQMVRHGEWILPRRQGVLASKPPLYHWLAAVPVSLLGCSDAALRFPSALGAAVMLLATAALASGGAVATSALATLIVTASWGFWTAALEARVDMVFAAALTVALAGALLAIRDGRRGGPIAFWGGVVAATLTKGPAGMVLPASVLAVYALWSRDLVGLRRIGSPILAAAAGTLVASWYAAALRVGGDEFVAVHLRKENLDRLLGLGEFARDRDRFRARLFGVFAARVFPWNLALVDRLLRGRPSGTGAATERFVHTWWLVVLLGYSLSAKQRSVYLLPLYPPIAVLAARTVSERLAPHRLAVLAVAATLSLSMYAATLHLRAQAGADANLLAVAGTMARALPSDAVVLAAPGVSENEVIVLGWLLDRPILRRRHPCREGATYALLPRDARTTEDRAIILVDDPRAARLVRCPGAS